MLQFRQRPFARRWRRLGERERGTEFLARAIRAYRAALDEYTRERVPLRWAMTQNNFGVALSVLGVRESGTLPLKQAVEAFRGAFQERTRERVHAEACAAPKSQKELECEKLAQVIEAERGRRNDNGIRLLDKAGERGGMLLMAGSPARAGIDPLRSPLSRRKAAPIGLPDPPGSGSRPHLGALRGSIRRA